VTPTRWPSLVGLIVLTGLLGWFVASREGLLGALPAYAPVTAGLIAVFELALARVVSRKVRHLGHGKPMHPLQIARAAVLAKASSATGALLLGFYGGFFLWARLQDQLRAAAHDATVAGWSAVACLLLLVGALLLERACRTPQPPD
jgi:hypothetical protein